MFVFVHQSMGQLPGSASLSWSPQGFLMSLQQAASHLPVYFSTSRASAGTVAWIIYVCHPPKKWVCKHIFLGKDMTKKESGYVWCILWYRLGTGISSLLPHYLGKGMCQVNWDSKCRLVNYHFLAELQSQVAKGMGTWKNQKLESTTTVYSLAWIFTFISFAKYAHFFKISKFSLHHIITLRVHIDLMSCIRSGGWCLFIVPLTLKN